MILNRKQFNNKMISFINDQYSDLKMNLEFYFCERKKVKGLYKISRSAKGVIISNGKMEKEWTKNSKHKFTPVGKPAREILSKKKSITFYFPSEVGIYDVIQADLMIKDLFDLLKKCEK